MSVTTTTTWNQHLRALCSDDSACQKLMKGTNTSIEVMTSPPPTTTTSSSNHEEKPTKLQLELLSLAASVRENIMARPQTGAPPSAKELFFSSSFGQQESEDNTSSSSSSSSSRRGFCNWLIPRRIMIGQYPGQNPLRDGPSMEDSTGHLKRMTNDAKISVFCSLQRETPSQSDNDAWGRQEEEEEDGCGKWYLQPESIRKQLPLPFTHYAPIVRSLQQQQQQHQQHQDDNGHDDEAIRFVHAPIEDLSVPQCQQPLQRLLLELLQYLNNGKTIYIHCWGGRGRAGLVGACLLTLIWPHLTAETILEWIQKGYATRLGHDQLAPEYSTSPQTSLQREYVKSFVHQYQKIYHVFLEKRYDTKQTSGTSDQKTIVKSKVLILE